MRVPKKLMMMMSGGFSPKNIVGLTLWLNADDLAGADGDAVAAWADQSGNGNNFTQGAGAKQPLLKKALNGINNHNVVRFDGADDLMVAANFSSTTQGTIFAVVRLNGTLKDQQVILGSADEATPATNFFSIYAYVADYTVPYMGIYNTAGGNYLQASHQQTVNLPSIMMTKSTGAVYSQRSNGRDEVLQVNTGLNDGDWFGDVVDRDNITIGALKWNAEVQWLRGDIAELIIYDTGLGASDITTVENYLAAKYSIPLGELDGSGLVLDESWRTVGAATFALQSKVGITNPVIAAAHVTDVPGCTYVADPYIVREGSLFYMFYEAFYGSGTKLVYSTSPDGLTWTYGSAIMDAINGGTTNLSFPYVFKASGTWFMLLNQDRHEARLLKATNFPTQWVAVDVLYNAVNWDFVDTVVFPWGGNWYLFTLDNTNGQLRIFYASKLYGEAYTEHPSSPMHVGDELSNPCGRPILRATAIDFYFYDHTYVIGGTQAVRAYQITTLSPTEYVEAALASDPLLTSGPGWRASGHHHIDRVDSTLTVVDGVNAGVYSIGLFEDV